MKLFRTSLYLLILAIFVGASAVSARADMTFDQALYGAYDGTGDVWDDSNWGEFPSEPWSGQFQVGVWINLTQVDDELTGCTITQWRDSSGVWVQFGAYSTSSGDSHFIARHDNGTPTNYSDDFGFCVVDIGTACDFDYNHNECEYKLECTATGITTADVGGDPGGLSTEPLTLLQPGQGGDDPVPGEELVPITWTKTYTGQDVTIDFPRSFTGGNGTAGPFQWADDGDSLTLSVTTIDGSEAPYPPGNAASWAFCRTGSVYLETYEDADHKARWRPSVDNLEGAASSSHPDPDGDAPTTATWNYTLNYLSADHHGYIGFDGVSAQDYHALGGGNHDGYYSTTSWTPIDADFDVEYGQLGLGGPVRYYDQQMEIEGPSSLYNWTVVRYHIDYGYETLTGQCTATYNNGIWTVEFPDFADTGDGRFDDHQAATLYAISAQDGDPNCDDPDGRWMKPVGCMFNYHGGQPNVGDWNEEEWRWASFTVN